MSFLILLSLYLFSGLIGYCLIRTFIQFILGWEWTRSDDLVFLWTGLSLGWFALIGFCLWIGCVCFNKLLRKVHLNVY